MKQVTVTVSVGDRRVTLEGPEDFVRAEVRRLAALASTNGKGKADNPGGEASQPGVAVPRSEKQFIAEKKPSGHSETVAALAFYLREVGAAEFDADDMRRAYIRANCRPPKVMAQALRDARNKHDYVEKGSAKGKFRLSAHGERTVIFDLPREAQS